MVLPATFDTSHVKPGGDDLRFSTSPQHADELPYYIESWSPGVVSYVWVSVPSVPAGASAIYLFYGNPAAAPASSFTATFPHAMRTAGGGAGSFIATGDIVVDWFELRAGDTLILPQGAPLHLSARRVILSGIVGGNGRGFAGGPAPDGHGGGPGGGAASSPVDTESSGGGGNAGPGGHGGEHVAGNGGAGGPSGGTATGDDVALGGGGGGANANAGGAGGGAVSVLGWRTTVVDLLRADGLQNVGGSDRNGGGGAGGSILVAGYLLDLSAATLSAVGGAGGDCAQSTGSGGGGGSGGRIELKVHAGGTLAQPASMTVTGGPGGTCASTTAPGAAGSAGTTAVDSASMLVTGVVAALGAEQPLDHSAAVAVQSPAMQLRWAAQSAEVRHSAPTPPPPPASLDEPPSLAWPASPAWPPSPCGHGGSSPSSSPPPSWSSSLPPSQWLPWWPGCAWWSWSSHFEPGFFVGDSGASSPSLHTPSPSPPP